MERLDVAQKGPMGCGRKGGSLESGYGAVGVAPPGRTLDVEPGLALMG